MPLLTRERSRRWVIDELAAVRQKWSVALWAYVLMPEHVHVLLCPRAAHHEMHRILASLKRPVSTAAKAHLLAGVRVSDSLATRWLERLTVTYPGRRVFRFWQPGGGFDRNIFREKSVPAIIDYIHANPVRRGLCAVPTDWEWSSARFWDGQDDVPLAMDQPFE